MGLPCLVGVGVDGKVEEEEEEEEERRSEQRTNKQKYPFARAASSTLIGGERRWMAHSGCAGKHQNPIPFFFVVLPPLFPSLFSWIRRLFSSPLPLSLPALQVNRWRARQRLHIPMGTFVSRQAQPHAQTLLIKH